MKVYPIVEGHGEVEAAPVLLRRLLAEADCQNVGVGRPIRRTQSQLRSKEGIQAGVRLALLQPECAAVVILFDGEDVRVYRLEMLSAPKELILDLREGSVSECRPDLDAKRETVYMWIADKRIPAHEVGMPWKFRMSQVDAWRQAGNAGRNYALSRRRPNGLAVGGGMRR